MSKTGAKPLRFLPSALALGREALATRDSRRQTRSAQFANRLAAVGDDGMGAAFVVGPLGAEVDLQVAEDGGGDVGWDDAAFLQIGAFVVGAADDLAVRQSAACDDDRHAVGPVRAAAGGGDLGRAAEFAHHQDQRAVEQAAAFEIGDESVEAAVDAGEEGLEALEETAPDDVVAVIVEDAEAAADDHEGDACLDQPAGQKGLFAEAVAAVGVADSVGLPLDFDGFSGLAGEDHVEGLAVVLIEPGHRVAGIQLAPQAVELAPQSVAILGARDAHPFGHVEAADEVGFANGVVGGAQVARAPNIGIPQRIVGFGHADEGRHLAIVGSAELGGEGTHRGIASLQRAGETGLQILKRLRVARLHHGTVMIVAVAAIDRTDVRPAGP